MLDRPSYFITAFMFCVRFNKNQKLITQYHHWVTAGFSSAHPSSNAAASLQPKRDELDRDLVIGAPIFKSVLVYKPCSNGLGVKNMLRKYPPQYYTTSTSLNWFCRAECINAFNLILTLHSECWSKKSWLKSEQEAFLWICYSPVLVNQRES